MPFELSCTDFTFHRGRVESAGLLEADVLGLFGSYRELSPNDPEAAVRRRSRDAYERPIEFAHGVGAHGVTIVPGMDVEHYPRES